MTLKVLRRETSVIGYGDSEKRGDYKRNFINTLSAGFSPQERHCALAAFALQTGGFTSNKRNFDNEYVLYFSCTDLRLCM
jgi:hypothetical protein